MLRNKLVRSDGSVIDSSVIISCEFTEEVNSSTNLAVGNATASELTVEILATSPVQQGEVLTYYMVEDGVETKIGVFNAEKPTMATRTTMRFSAYDNIVKTEKNISDWLRENQSLFPMTLFNLVQRVCSYCGVTFISTNFPNFDVSVPAFYADNLTCRQVLSWASAIAGRFLRANANGELEFSWYRTSASTTVEPSKTGGSGAITLTDDGAGNVSIASKNIEVTDDGEGNVVVNATNLKVVTTETGVALESVNAIPYFSNALSYENYTTDLIERVQINHSEDDVGTIYPADIEGNCFTVSNNMILGLLDSTTLVQIASSLYTHLKDISYVPFSVTVPRTIGVRAGDIIRVITSGGKSFDTYVMKVDVTPSGTTLSATGDKSYGSNAAVSSEKYSNLTGKILAISKTIEGLVVENKDLVGRVGTLEVNTEKFETTVGKTYVTEDAFGKYQTSVNNRFTQTANGFEFSFSETKNAIGDVDGKLTEEVNKRAAHIRFDDGNIILGRTDNDILLILKNDRVSFVRNVDGLPEVAWFADDSLHVTEGRFMTQLRIGNFGFQPGANGNLSFRKVVT
jgi:hypothetical protein